jgi:hypothetical protein
MVWMKILFQREVLNNLYLLILQVMAMIGTVVAVLQSNVPYSIIFILLGIWTQLHRIEEKL